MFISNYINHHDKSEVAGATQKPTSLLQDLLTAGEEFIVEKVEGPPIVRRYCVFCSGPITNAAPSWVCEFSGDVTSRPVVAPGRVCECSWCEYNQDLAKPGPANTVCDSKSCGKAQRALQKRNERARKKEAAQIQILDIITARPELDDRDIAATLQDVPVLWVKQARKCVA